MTRLIARSETDKDKNAVPSVAYKITIFILVLIILGLVAALIAVSVKESDDSKNSAFSQCSQKFTLKPKYTKSQDLYRDLSEAELRQVRDYILNVASLNVTPFESATVNSNYIFLIELQNPIKDDAIAYLDHNGPKPTRAANVILFKGAETPPVVQEILVYFDRPMSYESNPLLTDRTIPFHVRPANKHGNAIQEKMINDFGIKTHQVLKELFGGYVIINCPDRCLTYISLPPRPMPSSNEFRSAAWFMRSVPGITIQAVGLQLFFRGEGNNGSDWKTRVSN
jgi:hypothetical protein